MKVTFFFRKKRENNHSIERVFNTVIQNLSDAISTVQVEVPKSGAKPWAMLTNMAFAKKMAGTINHITGDVHYIVIRMPKNKNILTIHDIESILTGNALKRWLFKLLWFKWPIKKCTYVTVISQSTKEKLQEIISIDPQKIKVIPNPVVNNFAFRPREVLNQIPVLLQIGTKKNKNLPNLILAIKDISCHLIVVGSLDNEQKSLLENHQISFENHVNISDDEMKKLYDRADILTFTSLFEGFGLPIIEAQLSGVPVITSNLSSMPEVSGDGAMKVDPHNIDEIKKGIEKLISDTTLRKELIAQGKINAAKYDVHAITNLYVDLYNQLNEHG